MWQCTSGGVRKKKQRIVWCVLKFMFGKEFSVCLCRFVVRRRAYKELRFQRERERERERERLRVLVWP